MALGKNLKKRKLISEEPKKAPKKPSSSKKKAVKTEKALIAKPKSKKATRAPKKAVPVKKKHIDKVPEVKTQQAETGLPIFIAKELYDLKTSLRNRYKEDVSGLSGRVIQFVIIVIGGEHYAIDIDCVKEVVPVTNLSKTPNTPKHIQGIANVRGATYVVFDLTQKFKLEGEFTANYLLVLENEGIAAALSLSLLPTTRKINGDNISSELHMIENASLDVSYIKGLIQDDDKLIYYLDVIELLKNDKAIVVPDNLIDSKK
ncbi:chemotaxis protein CheW [Ekhidna sp. To15]|uniref:chemotaxis protein CheW n=1 Tax=Ekhidna sp. To15 TaxID=3395267 RepID=UPI003F522EF6